MTDAVIVLPLQVHTINQEENGLGNHHRPEEKHGNHVIGVFPCVGVDIGDRSIVYSLKQGFSGFQTTVQGKDQRRRKQGRWNNNPELNQGGEFDIVILFIEEKAAERNDGWCHQKDNQMRYGFRPKERFRKNVTHRCNHNSPAQIAEQNIRSRVTRQNAVNDYPEQANQARNKVKRCQ